MNHLISIFLAAIIIAVFSYACLADTYVAGPVTGVWTTAGNTYYVTDSIYVPTNQSLTIQAGVHVVFWGHYKFSVHPGATLKALGAPGDSITFTPQFAAGWHGIRFNNASSACSLSYCILRKGIASGNGEDAKGGAIYCSNSNPVIQHSRIDSCQASSQVSGGGIYCTSNSDPNISFNLITRNIRGGIYCDNSNPTISNNNISGNVAGTSGLCSGIYCSESNPNIINNVISKNMGGGEITCWNFSSPLITGNTISGDDSLYGAYGLGIACDMMSYPSILNNNIMHNYGGILAGNTGTTGYPGPLIYGNYISENRTDGPDGGWGGGIKCGGPVRIINNVIIGNSTGGNGHGGGLCFSLYPGTTGLVVYGNVIKNNMAGSGGGVYFSSGALSDTFELNELSNNTAYSNGGGIYFNSCTISLNKNTITWNMASYGGAIYHSNSSLMSRNCIFWGNTAPTGSQFYLGTSSSANVTYSDIQEFWPGTGNIFTYPAFVDTTHDDYRLSWGSPCIDSGDPASLYNDPDSTRADMGCYYYPQNMPVRIILTPYGTPIQIPASGGSFNFQIIATNSSNVPHQMTVHCNITLPSGQIYGPVLGPITINMPANISISRVRTQNIPGSAPPGMYHYNAYAVVGPTTSSDAFTFVKLEGNAQDEGLSGWSNTGEDFGELTASETIHPSSFILYPCVPNPFNPSTAISYELPAASVVSLKVYDTAGRLVATLVSGWQPAGTKSIVWNAFDKASGVYIVTLSAAQGQAAAKVVVVK
jgi:parallel beta-helix repeat protein/predicted outer membrane repeat protein